MRTPLSKLPFRLTSDYRINDDVGTNLYTNDSRSTQRQLLDGEYIVQACNNFPKAIELLKELRRQDKEWQWVERFSEKIDQFLKSIG